MTGAWDRKRAAHLYRRAGFGGTPDELDLAVWLGREGAVSRLVDYEAISTADLDAYLDLFGFDVAGYGDVTYDRAQNLLRWWYLRMQHSSRPLEEKMTLFWHNHFATSVLKVGPQLMYTQNQIFRRLGMGKFGDLLLEVSRDPAMLIWLDNASNVKAAPNENFAREVMELFTMGIGHYTQQDVTEAARAFTGWTIDAANNNAFIFNPDVHDNDVKIFLGNRGFFRGEHIIAILAARPETAIFITAKLARFFLGAEPSPDLATQLQKLYVSTAGDIREISRAILLSDDFDASAERPNMFKSPVETVVSAYRSLSVRDDPATFVAWSEMMGQALSKPPNVGGWKGGRSWMNTGSYLARISFAFSIMTRASRAVEAPLTSEGFRWDAGEFFQGRSFSSSDALIDFLADRLSLVYVSDVLRQSLRSYIVLFGDPFTWTPASYDLARGAIYLVMASPEYQLQ